MERGDNVLARSSLVIAFLSGCAGFVLLFGAARLMGYFEMPGAPKEHESVGAAIVCALAIFCFFEAYRFYRVLRLTGDSGPLLCTKAPKRTEKELTTNA